MCDSILEFFLAWISPTTLCGNCTINLMYCILQVLRNMMPYMLVSYFKQTKFHQRSLNLFRVLSRVMVPANCTFRVPSFVACSLVSLTKLCSILAFFATSFPKITMHKPQDVMNAYQPVHPRSRKHNRTAKHSNLTESQRICTHLSLGWVIHTKSLSTSLYPSFSSQLLFITFKLL